MTERKPFFSIVIPCYNNGSYAPGQYVDRVLDSICKQGLEKDDIEVIISDDHSKFPYTDTLDSYRGRLNIKYVETDYNFAPGNTRQRGSEEATGEWLCFIDHDDIFLPNALSLVKEYIEKCKEEYVVYSSFDKVKCVDKNFSLMEHFNRTALKNWVHGKFYNIENFWKPFHIHFIKDLKTHEDIALGKLVECALMKLDRKPLYIDEPIYFWIFNPTSISHGTYYPQDMDSEEATSKFLESHYDDFLTAQIYTILESHSNGTVTTSQAISLVIPTFISAWLTLSTFNTNEISHYMMINDAYCSRAWHRVKEQLNVNTTVFKVLLAKMFPKLVEESNQYAKENNVSVTFAEWLADIDKIDYKSILEKTVDKVEEDDNHRPYFSCVIACYNDGRYKEGVYLDRLLESLVRQGLPREELEVVLSDDCSPIPFIDDIRKKFDDKLIIKYTKTDYNFAPGNTRAKGVEIATGCWLCFADHDDMFYDYAFRQVANSIEKKEEEHFVFGDFDGVLPDGTIERKYEKSLNWCHAKFYNRDNFWDKYGIHFIKDLKSHEDIAICTQVACALASNVPTYTYIHRPLYMWTDNPQSVSHAKYTVETEEGPREFLEVFYEDYITSTGWMYLDQFNQHKVKLTYAVKGAIEIMCYAYFYQQGFMFRRPDDYYKKNLEVAGKYIDACKEKFNITNESIYDVVSSNRAAMYYNVMEQANMASGKYIPTYTFKQWLELVSPEK